MHYQSFQVAKKSYVRSFQNGRRIIIKATNAARNSNAAIPKEEASVLFTTSFRTLKAYSAKSPRAEHVPQRNKMKSSEAILIARTGEVS